MNNPQNSVMRFVDESTGSATLAGERYFSFGCLPDEAQTLYGNMFEIRIADGWEPSVATIDVQFVDTDGRRISVDEWHFVSPNASPEGPIDGLWIGRVALDNALTLQGQVFIRPIQTVRITAMYVTAVRDQDVDS